MKKLATMTLGILGTSLSSSLALAEGLEEVVVTAQHRAQNVQDVPIAVTALSADTLEVADIFDAGSIAQNVPGLAYAEFSPGQANIAMRGISSADDGAGLDNSVALFLDGVYIGRGASINFDMFDLERIEVLRGPQGTLFGRNAIGGAISVVTAKPTEEFTAKIGATVGNEGILRYQALVGGALSDNLFGKVTVNHREHDGFVENVVLNKDQQDEDQTSFRGQLRWVGDNSEWLLSGDYMEDDREDMGRTPIVNNAPLTNILQANGGLNARQSGAPADGFSKREAWGISLTGEYKFESGTLTMIAAHRHAETDWEMASAGAPLGAIGLPFDEVIDDIVEDIDTNSLELRWTSDLEGSFNYTAGFFYFTEETDRVEQFKITRAGSYDDPNVPFRITDIGDQAVFGNEYSATANETTSYALYGQGTWDISDAWSLVVGARYTVDEKDYSATSVNCGGARAGTPFENFAACEGLGSSLRIIAESFTVNPSDDWNDFSPMVSLQYRPSDETMIFFTASKGFKSGGFAGSQGVEAAASTPVDPETAINYELGFKGDLLDNSLRLNAAVFYTDYEDLQIVRFGPVPGSDFGTFQTTNIGEAEIKGAEVELTWYLTDNLHLTGFYAYLDTEVNDLLIEGANGTFDASGQNLLRAPENSSSLSINYTMPTSIGDVDFRLAFSHQDEQRTDYIDPRIVQDRFDLWDGRIAWTSESGNVDVALWGKNLTGEDYVSHMYVIGPGGIGVWGAPRTYGVTATWKM